MSTRRKQKLRRREEKEADARIRRRNIVNRILWSLDLEPIVDLLPAHLFEGIEDRISPGIEVVAAEDSRDDPEVKDAVRRIKDILIRPVRATHRDREFVLAPEDLFRGYDLIVGTFHGYARLARGRNPRIRDIGRIRPLLDEACETLAHFDGRWYAEVMGLLMSDICFVTDRRFEVDGRILSAASSRARKAEGSVYRRIEVRLHHARPRVVTLGGERQALYRCERSTGPGGLHLIRWNCPDLGIEGPRVDLPVLVSEHALERLDQRFDLPRRFRPLLHNMMMDSLRSPVFTPADRGRYLVEARLGPTRLGYFVVEVTPSFVWVVTFLLLTMAGTPESACLREKLGMSRRHIEDYKLDNINTLMGSNISQDPLLAGILSECGCGHLIRRSGREGERDWLSEFGDRLKSAFELREAPDGFKVGRKWVRWSRQETPTEPGDEPEPGPA